MDLPALKIKLTPLVKKKIIDGSLCSLEFIPEVTDVLKNFRSSTWKQKNDTMEYTLPITYKVVFKKVKKNSDKVYHSCVDLITNSSKNDLDEDVAQISRVTSDNNISNDPHKEDNILQSDNKNNESDDSVVEIDTIVTYKSTYANHTLMVEKSCEFIPQLETNNNKVKLLKHWKECQLKHAYGIFKKSSDFNYEQEGDVKGKTEKLEDSENLLKQNELYSYCSNDNEKKSVTSNTKIMKLSCTPICRVNAYNNPIYSVSNVGDASNLLQIQDTFTQPEMMTNKKRIVKNQVCVALKKFKNEKTKDKYKDRIIPEIKVAQFVQELERDFLPLKLILNDIKYKCDALDPELLVNSKFLPKYSPSTKLYSNEISNRVVFSIVYDD